MVKYAALFLFLVIFPFLLGIPWTSILPANNRNRFFACFPIGCFIEAGLFQLIAFPFGYFGIRFSWMCIVYIVIIIVCCVISIIYGMKYKIITFTLEGFTPFEMFYFTAFILLLGVQIYNGYRMDTTYMSFDDAYYVTYAADTLFTDHIGVLNANTGLARDPEVFRMMQTSLVFPALLSLFSDIPVTIMTRTVLQVYYILLAYSVYAYMSSVLFEKRENRLVFLILMCVLYIFGYYSHYSVTFRLLGPNYQGKAIVATCYLPLLFTLYIEMLSQPYTKKFGLLLLLLSAAVIGMSMFGVTIMIMNSVIVIVMSLAQKRNWKKNLLYSVWASILPAISCMIYFIYKNHRW